MIIQWIAEHFRNTQALLLAVGIGMAWMGLRSRQRESSFKTREADRADLKKILNQKSATSLADARLNKPGSKASPPPLALPGIRLQGEPHEILGIPETASEAEIMKAYKDAIKNYHPDRIQGEARSQMKFYQDASAQLNHAKNEMLKRLKRS